MFISMRVAIESLENLVAGISAQKGAPVAAVIVCPAGEPLAMLRMDGVPSRIAAIALAKAYSAAYREASTLSFKAFLAEHGAALADFGNPRLTSLPGGVPLKVHGVTVGAVGVSGRLPADDHALAESCAATVLSALERLGS